MRLIGVIKDFMFNLLYFHLEKVVFLLRFKSLNNRPRVKERTFGINYAGYLGSEKGLGEAARSIIKVIQKAGIPLTLNNIEHRWQKDVEKTFVDLYRNNNPYYINILHVNADLVPYIANNLGRSWFKGRYNIGYWFWELEDFPQKWAVSFRCFDEIWTGSEFCKKSIESISPVPVQVMPLSVEVKLESIYDRGSFGLRNDSFIFLFVFDLNSHFERKNPLAVITAFRHAFDGRTEKDVTLVLKFTGTKQYPEAYKQIIRAADGLPVKLFPEYMKRERLYGLMSVCDCYVSLHRSEGFGLTIAEAMSLGKPVIATAYSGNMDFMNTNNSFPVRYRMKRIERSVGPYKKGAEWAEPDVIHASDLMRMVVNNPMKAKEIGYAAAQHIKNTLSPEALSHNLRTLLENMQKYHA